MASTNSHIYLALECVLGPELHAQIEGRGSPGLPADDVRFYAAVIVLAISHMHSCGVIYRDLKPENILLDEQGYPKLVDFGNARHLPGGQKTYTLCGALEYLAPEMVTGVGCDKGVDWWAFGILVYDMLVGDTPFSGQREGHSSELVIMKAITSGRFRIPRQVKKCAGAKGLVTRLLVQQSAQRLGCMHGGCRELSRAEFFGDLLNSPRDLLLREARGPAPVMRPTTPAVADASYTLAPIDEDYTSESGWHDWL